MHRLAFLFKSNLRGVWTGVVCAVIVWYLTTTMGVFIGVEDWMLDGAFITRGKRPTRSNVVIIAVDESSLRKLGKSTSFISPELDRVVRYAHARGAAVIGVDLMVPEDMSGLKDIAGPDAAGDPRSLGAAVRDCGNIVLPRWWLGKEEGGDDTPWIRPLVQWWRAKDFENPAVTDLGAVNLYEDGDQFVRRVQLLWNEEPDPEPGDQLKPVVHFALALYLVKHRLTLSEQDGIPVVNGRPVPVDERGLMKINYVGPPGSFPTVPFHRVLEAVKAEEGKLPPPEMPDLNGAVVLIGVTARSLQDNHATPYANHYARWWAAGQTPGRMSGTEVLANAYATLEDEAYIRKPGRVETLLLLLTFGMAMGYTFYRAGLVGGLGMAVLHHFAWKALALGVFMLLAVRLPVVSMVVLGGVLYAATFALRWRQTRLMMRAFMASAIADWFENDPSRMGRNVEEREVTVLFADIRGFSTFSDGRNPREVARLLMEYFDVLVPMIERHGGALNQYMGDGVMVLFGATDDQRDHAVRAVRAAVDMVRAVRANAEKWAGLGLPGLRIGVGINTGATVVGSIGAQHLMDFTAIGDTTNMAARIEAYNKELKTEILISDNTWNQITPEERARLGCDPQGRPFVPKGKSMALLVHVVQADPGTGILAI